MVIFFGGRGGGKKEGGRIKRKAGWKKTEKEKWGPLGPWGFTQKDVGNLHPARRGKKGVNKPQLRWEKLLYFIGLCKRADDI